MQGRRSTCIERLYNRDSSLRHFPQHSFQGESSYTMPRDVRPSMCCRHSHVGDSSGRSIKDRRHYDSRGYKHRSDRRNSSSSNGMHQKRVKPRQFSINGLFTGTGRFVESDDVDEFENRAVMKTKLMQSESNKIRTQLIENRLKDGLIKTNNIVQNIKSEGKSEINSKEINKKPVVSPTEKIIDTKIPHDISSLRKPINEEELINVSTAIKEEKKDRKKPDEIYREMDEMLRIIYKKYSELKKNNCNNSPKNVSRTPKMWMACSKNGFYSSKNQFSSVRARIRRRYMLNGSHFNRRNDQTKARRCEEELTGQDLDKDITESVQKWDKDIDVQKEPIRNNVLVGEENFDTLKKELREEFKYSSDYRGSNKILVNYDSKMKLIKSKTGNILESISDNVQTVENKHEKLDIENSKSGLITRYRKENENVSEESSSPSSHSNSDTDSDQNDDKLTKFSHHKFVKTDLNKTKCGGFYSVKLNGRYYKVTSMQCLIDDPVTFVENSPYSLQSKSEIRRDGSSKHVQKELTKEHVKMLSSSTVDTITSSEPGEKDTNKHIGGENETESTIILEPKGEGHFKTEANINFQNSLEKPELQKNYFSFISRIQINSFAPSRDNVKELDCKKEIELTNSKSVIFSDTESTNSSPYCKYYYFDPTRKDMIQIPLCDDKSDSSERMETTNLTAQVYSDMSDVYCKCDGGNVDKVTQIPIRVDKSVTVNEPVNNPADSNDSETNRIQVFRTESSTKHIFKIPSRSLGCTDDSSEHRNEALIADSDKYKKVRFVHVPKSVKEEEVLHSPTLQNARSSVERRKKSLARCLQKLKNKFNNNK